MLSKKMRIIDLTKGNLDEAYGEAAEVLRSGRLVAYPTESFYAIGADAMNERAVREVFTAKKRAPGKPLPVIAGDVGQVEELTAFLSDEAKRAVLELMPGPVTLIFYASEDLPEVLTAKTRKIGIRVPKHEVASRLALTFGGPVTATSANISGSPGLTEAKEVAAAFAHSVDLVLDGGKTGGAPVSTILDMTVSPPCLVREGALSRDMIKRVFPEVKP
jgi:L-threonylcarbamoyladenylate synthase